MSLLRAMIHVVRYLTAAYATASTHTGGTLVFGPGSAVKVGKGEVVQACSISLCLKPAGR